MDQRDLTTHSTGSPFTVRARPGAGGTVLTLAGEFDLSGLDTYRDAFDAAASADPGPILLELTALGFIDSSGLRCIVESLQRCRDEGRTLSVCDPAPQVQRLLALTGLAERLPLVPCPPDPARQPAA